MKQVMQHACSLQASAYAGWSSCRHQLCTCMQQSDRCSGCLTIVLHHALLCMSMHVSGRAGSARWQRPYIPALCYIFPSSKLIKLPWKLRGRCHRGLLLFAHSHFCWFLKDRRGAKTYHSARGVRLNRWRAFQRRLMAIPAREQRSSKLSVPSVT